MGTPTLPVECPPSATGAQSAVIVFEDVHLAFEDNHVLRGVSFQLPPGETKALFGVAGAGKSTILKLALGLMRPDAGRILVLGNEVTSMPEDALFPLRGRLGMRQIGPRPATSDGALVVPGYAIFDFTAAYRWKFIEVSASVENVFDSKWEEAAFAYVSRLPGEPAAGVNDTDFTAGAPINVYTAVTLYF